MILILTHPLFHIHFYELKCEHSCINRKYICKIVGVNECEIIFSLYSIGFDRSSLELIHQSRNFLINSTYDKFKRLA